MSTTVDNDIEFKVEDNVAAFLAGIEDPDELLPRDDDAIKILVSLCVDDLEESHIAVICDDIDSFDRNSGNALGVKFRVKVVTGLSEDLPEGLTLRQLHRLRCGLVRDFLLDLDLDEELSDTTLTVQGFEFGGVKQRIVDGSWITEIEITLEQVAGTNLAP